MKAALEGRPLAADSFRRHIDTCLGCMACVTACPSGVQYDRLIEHTRPLIEARGGRSLPDRLYRQLIFSLFPHPRRLAVLGGALRLVQRLGIQRAFRASGLAALLPDRIAALERLAPPPSSERGDIPETVPASGARRLRVGPLLGCVQRVFFPGVNHATVRVLAAEGCEVVTPPRQQCCGALWLHSGYIEEARDAARTMIDAFEESAGALDHVVVNSAGCGSAMKEYGELLKEDVRYADRACAFARRCVDVSELLAAIEPRAARHALRTRVAYHDACHLNHAQRIKAPPRQVLRSIPDLEVCEIGEPDVCCGSAGVYSLLEPGAGAALRDRKVAHVRATSCDVLVSSNPGCLLQIASGFDAADRIPTRHLVEVLDASIRNDPSGVFSRW